MANRESLGFAEQAQLYRKHLSEALKKPPKYTSNVNVLIQSVLDTSQMSQLLNTGIIRIKFGKVRIRTKE